MAEAATIFGKVQPSGSDKQRQDFTLAYRSLKPAPRPRAHRRPRAPPHGGSSHSRREEALREKCKAIYTHINRMSVSDLYRNLGNVGIDTKRIRFFSYVGSAVLEILVTEEGYDHVVAQLNARDFKIYSNFDPSTPPNRVPGFRAFSEQQKQDMRKAFKNRVTSILNLNAAHGRGINPAVADFYQSMADACPWFHSIPPSHSTPQVHGVGGGPVDA